MRLKISRASDPVGKMDEVDVEQSKFGDFILDLMKKEEYGVLIDLPENDGSCEIMITDDYLD